MARPLRIEFEGALYHVTLRGNASQSVFLNDKDRSNFLDTLADVVERYRWLCHTYCLMDNHYHLVIETPEANLSKGMRQLNGVYTQIFNRRYGRVGHLFQGRYKAMLVEKEGYLLELARYVVLNPVRAGLVSHPGGWKWSSYGATVGEEEAPAFLVVDWVLGQFSRKRREAQKAYRNFVAEGKGVKLWEQLEGGVFLGSEGFVGQLKSHLEEKLADKEIPKNQRLVARPSLEQIFSKAGESKATRNALTYQAVKDYGYTLKKVGEFLGLHYSTVSKAFRKGREITNFKTSYITDKGLLFQTGSSTFR
jgi:putative transposase